MPVPVRFAPTWRHERASSAAAPDDHNQGKRLDTVDGQLTDEQRATPKVVTTSGAAVVPSALRGFLDTLAQRIHQ
jgi:hypothetical protein